MIIEDRQRFTTTISLDLQRKFKAKCAEQGFRMNDVLESFMQMFSNEELKFDESKKIIAKKKD